MNFLKNFFTTIFIIILFPSLLALSFAVILNTTILDADFMISTLSSIDISFLLDNILEKEIPTEIPKEVRTMFAGQIRTLLENQLKTIVVPTYNYLLGESETLETVISLAGAKKALKPVILQYMLASQPEKYHPLIKKEYETYWKEFSSEIPDTIDLHKLIEDKNVFETIERIREILSIFKQVVLLLITASIILILLIMLIQRNLRSLLHIGGILFLLLGLIIFPLSLLFDYLMSADFFGKEIPVFIYSTLFSLISGITSNIRLIGIVYLIGGVFCLIISFILKRNKNKRTPRENEPDSNTE
ncbi:MAG: hypothetical protein JXJ04_00410 [Spirochaetales bacterium]|nr:hypothetical protein [Spirochaetales bacterium]